MRNSEVSDLSLKIASQFLVLYRFFLKYSGDQEVLFNFDVISKKVSPSSKGSSLDPDFLDKHGRLYLLRIARDSAQTLINLWSS